MTFFSPRRRDGPSYQLAIQLRDTLKKRGKLLKPAELNYWSEEFRRMGTKFGVEEVQRVLNWFCEQVEVDLVPVRSARTFMIYFDQVRGLMREDNEESTIDPRSKNLAEIIERNFPLPPEIIAKLPYLVQETRNNWETFCKRMEEKKENTIARRSDFLVSILEGRAANFVMDWFEVWSFLYGRMDHFHGNTSRLVFVPRSQRFIDHFWRTWSMEWCGKADTFDLLLKELCGASK